ncbi:MAG: BrnT family toxin [bacterium]|nr:BrnT family toxin [bacterium]
MRVIKFEWDEKNEDHIACHKVTTAEVEEVFVNRARFRRGKEGKMYALGVTDAGRHLFVVFAGKREGKTRVITARDMDKTEKRWFRRK